MICPMCKHEFRKPRKRKKKQTSRPVDPKAVARALDLYRNIGWGRWTIKEVTKMVQDEGWVISSGTIWRAIHGLRAKK